jgi:hypothetical protein
MLVQFIVTAMIASNTIARLLVYSMAPCPARM